MVRLEILLTVSGKDRAEGPRLRSSIPYMAQKSPDLKWLCRPGGVIQIKINCLNLCTQDLGIEQEQANSNFHTVGEETKNLCGSWLFETGTTGW